MGQVRALSAGLAALERTDAARRVHELRLAFHGDGKDVDKYLDSLEPPQEGPDPTDLFLAQHQGATDGSEPIA